jgi:flagellar biosynthesis protein FlhG
VKSIETLNYYEVLDLERSARPDDIERAYRMATTTWAEDSLALYSLFEERDAAIVRERITTAYRTLSDGDARRAYDLDAFGAAYEPEEGESEESAEGADTAGPSGAVEFDEMEAAFDSTLEDGAEQAEFDGPQLRRLRMQRGIEIDDIAEETKVSRPYLRYIEEEDWEALPASVYVRGFVAAYAGAIGLDPQKVAASYMPRYEEGRQEKARGRQLGRR